IPQPILDRLQAIGISELYPPQARAIEEGDPSKNIVIAIPTAAGKTLIAEIFMLTHILFPDSGIRGKAMYLTPLKALATEQYHTFKTHWDPLGVRVTFSTGDFDRVDKNLFNNDIIVLTNEKADSILRNHPELLAGVSCVVADEIHLMNDESRGVTLELILTKIRKLSPQTQIVGLSATINNAHELASWLDATLIQDDWRPVPLKEGAFLDHEIIFADGSTRAVDVPTEDPLQALLVDTIQGGGQILAFLGTRRNAQAAAKRFAEWLAPLLPPDFRRQAGETAEAFLDLEGEVTPQGRQLAEVLRAGTAFHHAGLGYPQRSFIEDQFRQGHIVAIAATPTLAAGINTPARRVIIKGLKRFAVEKGSQDIPIIEYKQMAGRAGRPGYDPYGESVVIARSPADLDDILAKYVRGTPEDITSKLNNESELKSHILGTIASGFATAWEEILAFFRLTFFSFQKDSHAVSVPSRKRRVPPAEEEVPARRSKGKKAGGEDYFQYVTSIGDEYLPQAQYGAPRHKELEESLHDALQYLVAEKMVNDGEDGSFAATSLGQKVSQLYIKPETAVEFRQHLQAMSQRISRHSLDVTPLTFLHAVARFPDADLPYVGQVEKEVLNRFYAKYANQLAFPPEFYPPRGDLDEFYPELKLAAILHSWIFEIPEEMLAKRFNVGSGDIHRYVETAEWLVHAAEVLCPFFRATKWQEILKRLTIRVNYGCREELLPLVSIRDIGRVRGRILYRAGYSTPEAVFEADPSEIARLPLFGPNLVERVRRNIASGVRKSNLSAAPPPETELEAEDNDSESDYQDLKKIPKQSKLF
ncbi:MAG TPA: DEAD/DEAH box helicase, partial [Candidatus Lokiarchaeia archaeon]|nr:DEAD/DEAH box helicase [Candidatus Lokiarchaeia archaeon]